MAGDYIKLDKDTLRKPEVFRLSKLLSIPRHHVVGLLVEFWSWCDSQIDAETGHASVTDFCDINSVVGHEGFAESLEAVGWLSQNGDGISIPNFDKHLSASAKTRLNAAERQRKRRHANVTKARDKSVTREEKRREDIDVEVFTSTSGVNSSFDGRKRFTKPTVNEIAFYCAERANQVDAQNFFDHYESNGWRVGKVPMKDWKAAVRNWEKNLEHKRTAAPARIDSSRIGEGTVRDPNDRF